MIIGGVLDDIFCPDKKLGSMRIICEDYPLNVGNCGSEEARLKSPLPGRKKPRFLDLRASYYLIEIPVDRCVKRLEWGAGGGIRGKGSFSECMSLVRRLFAMI